MLGLFDCLEIVLGGLEGESLLFRDSGACDNGLGAFLVLIESM
jgi:hypothetical protein